LSPSNRASWGAGQRSGRRPKARYFREAAGDVSNEEDSRSAAAISDGARSRRACSLETRGPSSSSVSCSSRSCGGGARLSERHATRGTTESLNAAWAPFLAPSAGGAKAQRRSAREVGGQPGQELRITGTRQLRRAPLIARSRAPSAPPPFSDPCCSGWRRVPIAPVPFMRVWIGPRSRREPRSRRPMPCER
jgi:hypothetical protein